MESLQNFDLIVPTINFSDMSNICFIVTSSAFIDGIDTSRPEVLHDEVTLGINTQLCVNSDPYTGLSVFVECLVPSRPNKISFSISWVNRCSPTGLTVLDIFWFWLDSLGVLAASSFFWFQFFHPIILEGNRWRKPRSHIHFLVCDFSWFHHNNESFQDPCDCYPWDEQAERILSVSCSNFDLQVLIQRWWWSVNWLHIRHDHCTGKRSRIITLSCKVGSIRLRPEWPWRTRKCRLEGSMGLRPEWPWRARR